MSTNRRAFVRHPTTLPVELRVLADAQAEPALVCDVGRGGVRLRVDGPVEVGIPAVVRFPILGHEYRFDARVVWSERGPAGWEVGLCFLGAEQRVCARMVEQICQIEAHRLAAEAAGRLLSSEEAAREWSRENAAAFPEF